MRLRERRGQIVGALMVLAAALLLAGCGSDDSGRAEPATAPPKAPAKNDPASEMVACLEDATYAVEPQDPGEYQVRRTEGGSIVANIDVLPNAREARKFERQLTVDYVSGQTAVAVLLAEADDSDGRVIGECLP